MTQLDLEKAEKAKNSSRSWFVIIFLYIMISWIYEELTKKHDFPSAFRTKIEQDISTKIHATKVHTTSDSEDMGYIVDKAYLDALEITNSNNATSVETSKETQNLKAHTGNK